MMHARRFLRRAVVAQPPALARRTTLPARRTRFALRRRLCSRAGNDSDGAGMVPGAGGGAPKPRQRHQRDATRVRLPTRTGATVSAAHPPQGSVHQPPPSDHGRDSGHVGTSRGASPLPPVREPRRATTTHMSGVAVPQPSSTPQATRGARSGGGGGGGGGGGVDFQHFELPKRPSADRRARAAWRENSPSQASVLQPPHDGASPTVASGAEPTEEAVGDVGGSILDPAFMDVAPHATQGHDTVLGDIGVDDAVSDVPDPLAAHHQGYGAAATDMVSGGTPGMFDADRAMAGATAESELEADGFAALEAGVDMDMDMDMDVDMAMDVDVEVGLQGSPNRRPRAVDEAALQSLDHLARVVSAEGAAAAAATQEADELRHKLCVIPRAMHVPSALLTLVGCLCVPVCIVCVCA